ncbi:MAG: undecaprenyl-diphosphate phosphatase [Rikenellaceae bacterium]|nr:undecaprenyl-diphosphate phosphatase [Rikenellaceae bacterium]MCL2692179.1 undecaprenyl-diphosphate phosphatase [Rikenellaceae bacterium]
MEIWQAVALGILQGLTEFLPVSSSGHLELASRLFGIEEPDNLSFTIAVHLGTVMSTIVVFRSEIGRLLGSVLRFKNNSNARLAMFLLLSMLPILVVGLALRGPIESLFTGNIALVGTMLLVTAALLLFAGRATKRAARRQATPKPLTAGRALLVGTAQAAAVVPGLSRSGATISTGLMLGMKRDEVTRFSFLMLLIPVIGMNFLEALRGAPAGEASVGSAAIAAGFVTSFAIGVVACRWMIALVRKDRLAWFALYCAAVGVFSIVWSLAG